MKKKNVNLIRVAQYDQTLIEKALREGRLFMEQPAYEADETRAEVRNTVARISAYACIDSVVARVWEALLEDGARVARFRITQREKVGTLNGYRIAAIVQYMCTCGLYDCHGCSFRALCSMLFSEADAERYRKNCLMYSMEEDECIIQKFVCHE